MKTKKIVTLISIVLLIQFSTATAEKNKTSYDLGMLYELAVKHAEQIKIAEEDLFIAKKDKTRAFSVLVPRFTAFGQYTMEDADVNTDPASPPSSFPELSQKTDTTTWGIRFDQSFTLNGRELIALGMAKKSIEKSSYDLDEVRESYLYQVASAYYMVLQATKGIDIAAANVKRLKKHRNAVATRLKLEDVTRTDMYRADSELSDARSQYIDAQNRLKFARASLKNLVNIPANFMLSEPSKNHMAQSKMDLNELQMTGLAKRALLKSSEADYEFAKKAKKHASGAYWPTVSIEGQYADSTVNTESDGSGVSSKIDTDNEAYSVGAKLTFTVFDGGLRRAEIKQAAAKKRKARLGLKIARKNIRLEIENTFLEVNTQKSKLKALSDKLKFSNQNYKAVAEMFKHGLSNSVDMMDANTMLVESERDLSNAEYGYKLALLKLKKATGTFSEETGLKK